jgi:hypothetical protein
MARRLVSVLSAYSVQDPEVGYCQGMVDLAAPFVAVMADESEAFWCFERVMSAARGCFVSGAEAVRDGLESLASVLSCSDPVLMHKLLRVGAGDCMFAYRMLLVRMRRELSLQDVRKGSFFPFLLSFLLPSFILPSICLLELSFSTLPLSLLRSSTYVSCFLLPPLVLPTSTPL